MPSSKALYGKTELLIDGLKEFLGVLTRIEENRKFGLGFDPLLQASAKRRLPGAHFTAQDDETFAFLKPIEKMRQRLLVGVGQLEEPRVGCEREGLLAKSIKGSIHEALSRAGVYLIGEANLR